MVHTAMEKGGKVKEEVQSILALTLAKAAAIVPGQVLTNEEMTGLVDGLFGVATPNYTPDGKTVLSVINEDDLEKLFQCKVDVVSKRGLHPLIEDDVLREAIEV